MEHIWLFPHTHTGLAHLNFDLNPVASGTEVVCEEWSLKLLGKLFFRSDQTVASSIVTGQIDIQDELAWL